MSDLEEGANDDDIGPMPAGGGQSILQGPHVDPLDNIT